MERAELASAFESLRQANSDLCENAPLLTKFEQGVALCEELDRVYLDVEPEEPAPSLETALLRSRVETILSQCSPLERLTLGTELESEFESIRSALQPPETEEPSTAISGQSITYSDYLTLRDQIGLGSKQVWSHGWNKAKSLGLVDQDGMLSIDGLRDVLARREGFMAAGAGKKTRWVYEIVTGNKQLP